jgi:hypothetical protein
MRPRIAFLASVLHAKKRRENGAIWVAHASRVLVSASRRNELFPKVSLPGGVGNFQGKSANAGGLRQHARGVLYPQTVRIVLMRIWTIGHSTRSIDDFVALLEDNGIKLLTDVRSLPRSRRYPHFSKPALEESLRQRGIRYEHFPELGGRRKPKPESHNTAWRNASFRGYADYMETEEFRKGVERLLALGNEFGETAIMCAEAVWWRCHRSLISDYLKARGVEVVHILDPNKIERHPYTSAARIVNGKLNYAPESFL